MSSSGRRPTTELRDLLNSDDRSVHRRKKLPTATVKGVLIGDKSLQYLEGTNVYRQEEHVG